jgi:hypothetical protein
MADAEIGERFPITARTLRGVIRPLIAASLRHLAFAQQLAAPAFSPQLRQITRSTLRRVHIFYRNSSKHTVITS